MLDLVDVVVSYLSRSDLAMNRTFLIILSVSLPLMILAGCWTKQNQTSTETTPTPTEAAAKKAIENRSLQPFTILEGTPYKVAVVGESGNRDKGFSSGSFSGKGYSKQFNYIFLNTQTKESVKLLPKSDSIFTRLETIGKKNPKGELIKVDAIWYEVIKDGVNKSDDRSKTTIATSTVAGTNYTELIPQVDRVLNTFQSGTTKILMVYELNKKYFIAELDLGERKLIETKELPNLE
jgi:hypothetical protein